MPWTLPNLLTLARILVTPVIALLPFIQGYWPKVICFFIFVAAAVTDVVDGYLARSRNEVSDVGKLLDPIADKLLLVATLVPIFWLTRHPTLPGNYQIPCGAGLTPPCFADYAIPWWGNLPLWVLLLLLGREAFMTLFRWRAKRRGVIIPAGGAGKVKTTFQSIFIGATIAWFAWKDALVEHHWVGWFQRFWDQFHGGVVAIALAAAVVLTAYSLGVYLYRYRALLKGSAGGS